MLRDMAGTGVLEGSIVSLKSLRALKSLGF